MRKLVPSLKEKLEKINQRYGGIGSLVVMGLLVVLLYFTLAHILMDVL